MSLCGRDDEKNNTAISYTFKHLASYSLLQGLCVYNIQQDINICCNFLKIMIKRWGDRRRQKAKFEVEKKNFFFIIPQRNFQFVFFY